MAAAGEGADTASALCAACQKSMVVGLGSHTCKRCSKDVHSHVMCEEASLRSVQMARPEESGISHVRQSTTTDAGGSSADHGSGGDHGSSGNRRARQGSPSSDDGVDSLAPGGRFAWLGERVRREPLEPPSVGRLAV